MSGMLARYEKLVARGELKPDPDQRRAADRLDRLERELEADEPGGLLGQLFARRKVNPRGVYMWGGVGRGKSMLMDLFHDSLDIKGKRRVHFHAFMLEVDALIREERAKQRGDPIGAVASDLAKDIRVLAFDEMVVTRRGGAFNRIGAVQAATLSALARKDRAEPAFASYAEMLSCFASVRPTSSSPFSRQCLRKASISNSKRS